MVTCYAIETDRLTKDYSVGFWSQRTRRAVDDLSIQVQQGEVFGFLGPNGAGKTTTQKLLMGLIFPTAGSARILGYPIEEVRMHRLIGYLPEQPYFYDYLTGRELLDYFARFFDFPSSERRERVERFLKLVGLQAAGDVQLRKYSKGMLQRIGIAQAILHDPQVVLLDEPMSGLDPVGRREVRDLILDLKRQRRTILFSTHILSDAEMLCDRVAVLLSGKLHGIGSPEEMVSIEVQSLEILVELPAGRELPACLSPQALRIGNRYRIQTPESDVYSVLEQLRKCEARILSMIQLKPTLEDYFFQLVGAEGPPSPAGAGSVR